MVLEVLIKNIEVSELRDLSEIPTKVSAADDSELPSLSSPVPPCGNDSQRYRDGLPQLVSGRNRPVAAAATGKHRHDESTTRHAIT